MDERSGWRDRALPGVGRSEGQADSMPDGHDETSPIAV